MGGVTRAFIDGTLAISCRERQKPRFVDFLVDYFGAQVEGVDMVLGALLAATPQTTKVPPGYGLTI